VRPEGPKTTNAMDCACILEKSCFRAQSTALASKPSFVDSKVNVALLLVVASMTVAAPSQITIAC